MRIKTQYQWLLMIFFTLFLCTAPSKCQLQQQEPRHQTLRANHGSFGGKLKSLNDAQLIERPRLSLEEHNVLHDDIRHQIASKRADLDSDGNKNLQTASSTKLNASESIPTIMVEHDGPTVTTVDFSNVLGPPPLAGDDPEEEPEYEDGDEQAFFNSEEEEGSNNYAYRQRAPTRKRPKKNMDLGKFYETNQKQKQQASNGGKTTPSEREFFGSEQQVADEVNSNDIAKNHSRLEEKREEPRKKTELGGSSRPSSIDEIKKRNVDVSVQKARNQNMLKFLMDELRSLSKESPSGDSKSHQDEGSSREADLYDYEDVLHTADDNDDDRIQRLKTTLKDKLQSKSARRTESSDKENSHESSNGVPPMATSPLQTILLAALKGIKRGEKGDFREKIVIEGEASKTGIDRLIGDEQNRIVISEAQRDFSDSTKDLGQLIARRPPFRSLVSRDDEERPVGLNGDAPSLDSAKGQQREASADFEVTSASIRAPVLAQHDDGQSIGDSKGASESNGLTNKRRRHSAPNEVLDDFDVDKKVEEYADGRNDRSLEPSWMMSARDPKLPSATQLEQDPVGTTDFDLDFDELDAATRRKILAERAQKLQEKSGVKRGQKKQMKERDYEANEQKFFNDIQRDTSDNMHDIDSTIKNIEASVPEKRPESERDEGKDESEEEEEAESKQVVLSPELGDRDSAESSSQDRIVSPDDAEALNEELNNIEEEASGKQMTLPTSNSD